MKVELDILTTYSGLEPEHEIPIIYVEPELLTDRAGLEFLYRFIALLKEVPSTIRGGPRPY
jgi:hypothetical protein